MIHNQTYWIDRLVYQKKINQISLWQQQINKVRSGAIRYMELVFRADIFERSFFIKSTDRCLSRIGMTLSKYKLLKGSFSLMGGFIGLVIYIFSIADIMSPLVFIIPLFSLFGFCIIDWYVIDKDQEIAYRIHHEFPKFLDLLHLYTASAAYESIGTAIYTIANSMHGTLASQLTEITSVQRFIDTDKFLDQFEERIQTPLAKDLVSTLRLTEIYGGNISEKIGILADESHKARMQNAKRQGQKASAALLIPLMLFHFPVAVVIFLAPTALALKQVFGW